MGNVRICVLILVTCSTTAAINLCADPPVNLVETSVTVHGARSSLDGERIDPYRICDISPGEEDSVLKPGVLTKIFQDNRVAGLHFFGAPLESSLRATVYYQVHFEDELLEEIGELTQLQYLNLHGVDLTRGIGLKFLTKLKHLRVIRFTDCKVEFKEILKHLPKCSDLEILKVWNHQSQWPEDDERFKNRRVVSKAEVARLIENSPQLYELSLQSSEVFEPEALSQFANLSELWNLHITPVDLTILANNKASSAQHTERAKLTKLFAEQGFRVWKQPGDSWKKSFRIYPTMIHVSQQETP